MAVAWVALVFSLQCLLQPRALASFVPRHFHNYAKGTETSGLRDYGHQESHILHDGSELHLNWRTTADPDTILSLDTEHSAGVRLVGCTPESLVLQLPESHVQHAEGWQHVVASSNYHSCEHLGAHPMYHRVVSIDKNKPHSAGGATLTMSTKELYTAAQILPDLTFDYHAMPIDSMEEQQKAARQAQVEQHRAGLHSGRKLGVSSDVGIVTITNKLTPNYGKVEGVFNFTPFSHANFGWNWNFETNTRRNPQFKYQLPGMNGYVLLKDPYLKVNGGLHINFTSHYNLDHLEQPPHVRIRTELEGNALINADIAAVTNITEDVAEDPLTSFHQPLLNNLTREAHYFSNVSFYIGNIPISLSPGISVGLDTFHLGVFKGAVRFALNTKLRVLGSAVYDSLEGMTARFVANALDIKFLPPTWLIFTKHLEFGALLTPSFWIKGGIGPVKDVELQAELRPYFNVSVMRVGDSGVGVQAMERTLAVQPVPKSTSHGVPHVEGHVQDGEGEVVVNMGSTPLKEHKGEGQPKAHSSRRLPELPNLTETTASNAPITNVALTAPGSPVNFTQKMGQSETNCSSQPLEYKMGAGLFFRFRVRNFQMPEGSPFAALAAFSNYDTRDIAITTKGFNEQLDKILPKGLCAGGVCSGTLPGCPAKKLNPILIPKVEFELNRTFRWSDKVSQAVKASIAYGLALTPEAIQVINAVVRSLVNDIKAMRCRWEPAEDCLPSFNINGVNITGCTFTGANYSWCSKKENFDGEERVKCSWRCPNGTEHWLAHPELGLKELGHGGRLLAENEEKESKHFVIEFAPGAVHYQLDEELLSGLMNRGAFHGLEDGREESRGSAKVVGFKLHYDTPPQGDMQQKDDDVVLSSAMGATRQQAAPARGPGGSALLLGGAVAAFALFALGATLVWRVRRGMTPTKYQTLEEAENGEDDEGQTA